MTRSARHPRADAYAALTSGDPGSQTITADDPRVCECALAAIPDAARAARRFTRDTLRQWGLDDLIDDAMLVVSELVTNAVVHGVHNSIEDIDGYVDTSADEQPILLRLVNRTTSVLCVVRDPNRTPPHVKGSGLLKETCRGLRIVAELSTAWGWTPSEQHGKFVWAVLDATRQPVNALVLGDAILKATHVRQAQPIPSLDRRM